VERVKLHKTAFKPT